MYLTVFFILFASYLYGSINIAVIISRYFNLPDPQTNGSNNPGTANMLRTAGAAPALATFLFDVSKGYLPIMIAAHNELTVTATTLVGLVAVLGHIFPLFNHFKGGKGVATALGVLLSIEPLIGPLFIISWIIIAATLRYASVASLSALFISALACSYFNITWIWLSFSLFIAVMVCHKKNIVKLIKNEEHKLTLKRWP